MTYPQSEPTTLALVKKHLAVDHDDENDLILEQMRSAREMCEVYTGRVFGVRSFLLRLSCWPHDGKVAFPVDSVSAVTSVKYRDADNVLQTVPTTDYRTWLTHSPPSLFLVTGFSYPTLELNDPAGIEIEYVAGETEIPARLGEAIRLIVGFIRQFPGGEPSLGHLSRGMPAGAVNILRTLWNGGL